MNPKWAQIAKNINQVIAMCKPTSTFNSCCDHVHGQSPRMVWDRKLDCAIVDIVQSSRRPCTSKTQHKLQLDLYLVVTCKCRSWLESPKSPRNQSVDIVLRDTTLSANSYRMWLTGNASWTFLSARWFFFDTFPRDMHSPPPYGHVPFLFACDGCRMEPCEEVSHSRIPLIYPTSKN